MEVRFSSPLTGKGSLVSMETICGSVDGHPQVAATKQSSTLPHRDCVRGGMMESEVSYHCPGVKKVTRGSKTLQCHMWKPHGKLKLPSPSAPFSPVQKRMSGKPRLLFPPDINEVGVLCWSNVTETNKQS